MNILFNSIPMIIAGIVYKIICKIFNIKYNPLLFFLLFAVAMAEYFIAESLYNTEIYGLGFLAAIVYNLFKVRDDSEESDTEPALVDEPVQSQFDDVKRNDVVFTFDNVNTPIEPTPAPVEKMDEIEALRRRFLELTGTDIRSGEKVEAATIEKPEDYYLKVIPRP